MKLIVKLSIPLLLVAAIAGCEWSSGGDSAWSSTPEWVNFSGVYRGSGGGVLVTDYTATPDTPGSIENVSGEQVGMTNGTSTVFSGVLTNVPLVEGSLSISSAQFNLSDNGDGTLSGSGATGTIEYGTGAWSVMLTGAPDAGDPITASYQYRIEGTIGSGSAGPGTSGITIYTFTVHQQGNHLEITDNNGSVYTGRLGDVSTTGGNRGDRVDELGNVEFEAGATAVGQFSVEGHSAAGMKVRIVGTLQGIVSGDGRNFGSRIMVGTWIEEGGRTGDVNGHASPIPVNGAGTLLQTGL